MSAVQAADDALVFTVQHGAEITEYTDWHIARGEALNRLQQQWTDSHGPALNDIDRKRRTITCEQVVWACTNGDYRGLESVPMTISAIPVERVTLERFTAAARATMDARARSTNVTTLPLPTENTPPHAVAA
jgi:hypothetical protein